MRTIGVYDMPLTFVQKHRAIYDKVFEKVVHRRLIVNRTPEMKQQLIDFADEMKGRSYEQNFGEIIKAVLGVRQVCTCLSRSQYGPT